MDDVHLVLVVKLFQNVDTLYSLIYAGIFLGVTIANFLENIEYIWMNDFVTYFCTAYKLGK